MVRIKGCPRCKGDVIFDRDLHGWFWTCLQCGYELESMVETQQHMGEREALSNSQPLKPTLPSYDADVDRAMTRKSILHVTQNDAGREAKRLLEGIGVRLDIIEEPLTSTPMLKTPIGWCVGLDKIRDFVDKRKARYGAVLQ